MATGHPLRRIDALAHHRAVRSLARAPSLLPVQVQSQVLDCGGGTRQWMTFPNGAHVAEVEIDRDTGQVEVARCATVDDYGVLVNPTVATGRAHGAIAQGIGQALLEHAVYDPGSGQLVDGLRAAARRRPPVL